MSKYKKIIVALDIYENYQAIIHGAQTLAERYQSQLHFTYVLPSVLTSIPYAYDFHTEIENEASEKLAVVQQQVGVSKEQIHLLHGNPKEEVSALAKKLEADLIIVGSHGKHGLELVLGSTANGILHLSPCDVLTIRVNSDNQHLVSENYHNVLLATDLESDNQHVIDTAKQIAQDYKANLHLVTVIPNTTATAIAYYPNIEADLRQESEKRIKELAQKVGAKPDNAHAVIGLPKLSIVEAAEKAQAELIIIGSHGRKALASALLGSTANAVLHSAKQDVLVVRI